jgi:hypothetical protein
MRWAIVAGSGEEGFCFLEMDMTVVVESVLDHRQHLRYSEADMPLIFFHPSLNLSADLCNDKLAKLT